jgi:type II secretory pathway pseudopilin PulG
VVKLAKSIKGSTLIEVLVAMILIVTTISFFFLSVSNIKKTFNIDFRTYALTIINSQLQNIDSLVEGDDIITYPSIKLIKTITAYNNNSRLFEIHISAISQDGGIVLEEKRIIYCEKQ